MTNSKVLRRFDWQPVASLPGEKGAILRLAQAGAGRCFAATQHGLWASRHDGLTWAPVAGPWKDALVSDVASSPAPERDRTLLVGTAVGLLRTDDGGNSWTTGAGQRPVGGVTAICLSPTFSQDGLAFIGTAEDGVLRSEDGGRTWAAWNFGLLDLNVLSLAIVPDFGHNETLLAGTDSGLFRSTNGGRAWREVTLDEDVTPVVSLAFSPKVSPGGHAYAFAGTDGGGLFGSWDGGKSWEPANTWAGSTCINSLLCGPGLLVAATNEGVSLSLDDGATWQSEDFPEPILALGLWSGQLWAGTTTTGLWRAQIELARSAHGR